jgi:hypothetical protein
MRQAHRHPQLRLERAVLFLFRHITRMLERQARAGYRCQ